MGRTYLEIVELLSVSQESPNREHRYENFLEAVSSYKKTKPFSFPERGRGVFLIGGTNGKGTVSKTLETLLSKISDRVGLYTSPHLIEPTERIRTGGVDLSEAELVETFELIEETVTRFSLSHFEILTLMMIEIFFGGRVRPVVELAIIEVGVGGRLDPTRMVPHETAVLTAISYDHEAILGSSLTSIAREKLAITEGATRVIYAPSSSLQVQNEIKEFAKRFSTTSFFESRIFLGEVKNRDGRPVWEIETPWGSQQLNLLGQRAIENTSVALEVLDRSGYEIEKLLPLLSGVRWPGRMERVALERREIYLSGDHNEQGVQSLKEILSHFDYENVWLVVGIGRGKPIKKMLTAYSEIPRAKTVLTLTPFRSLTLDDLSTFRTQVAAMMADPLDAVKAAVSKASERDLVVVSGSLYLIGHLLSLKVLERNL